MRHVILVRSFASSVLAVLLAGCVAPGSAIGTLSVRGHLAAESGQPLADREVQLILPAEYGLGGLDLVLNKPEDFGHADRSFSTRSDAAGNFRFDLGQTVYHMDVWLIPPLGGFPRRPPPPFVFLRFHQLSEYYAIETASGRYKVFELNGTEMALTESAVSQVAAHAEKDATAELRGTVAVIELLFRHHSSEQGE